MNEKDRIYYSLHLMTEAVQIAQGNYRGDLNNFPPNCGKVDIAYDLAYSALANLRTLRGRGPAIFKARALETLGDIASLVQGKPTVKPPSEYYTEALHMLNKVPNLTKVVEPITDRITQKILRKPQ